MKKLLVALFILSAPLAAQAQIIDRVKPTRIFPSSFLAGGKYIVVSDSTESGFYALSELKSIRADVNYITINIGGKQTKLKASQFLDEKWVPYHSTSPKQALFNYMDRYVYSAYPNYNY